MCLPDCSTGRRIIAQYVGLKESCREERQIGGDPNQPYPGTQKKPLPLLPSGPGGVRSHLLRGDQKGPPQKPGCELQERRIILFLTGNARPRGKFSQHPCRYMAFRTSHSSSHRFTASSTRNDPHPLDMLALGDSPHHVVARPGSQIENIIGQIAPTFVDHIHNVDILHREDRKHISQHA